MPKTRISRQFFLQENDSLNNSTMPIEVHENLNSSMPETYRQQPEQLPVLQGLSIKEISRTVKQMRDMFDTFMTSAKKADQDVTEDQMEELQLEFKAAKKRSREICRMESNPLIHNQMLYKTITK